ncbi:LysR family transcriptional regulator [Aquabacterium sp. J223]|uniref:LysR family transcriptional regulator n=1 Tax=Aquabacterium sp. J223 TaxID=2898431 RepID=UPI0021AE24E9|nr:LysR family transcriptional regulator [Aquabacterium sp. J223]UUX93991.1 LysR family transcriptional regulator [Aquabacterium sp. J223]
MPVPNALSLRQLQAFVHVYELRKLNAAAERMFITPSAVSIHIRDLEGVIGGRLFDRTTRAVSPTALAVSIRPTIERMLRDAEWLTRCFAEDVLAGGVVRFAVTPTLGHALLPDVIARYRADHPHVRLAIEDCPPQNFVDRIAAEELDFGVGRFDGEHVELEFETLMQDRLQFVCRREHPLAGQDEIRWAQLAGLPIIGVRLGNRARRLIDSAAAQAGIVLELAGEVAYLPSALWMVASDIGAAILPSIMTDDLQRFGLVSIPLVHPQVRRNVCVVKRRGRSCSPQAEAFMQALRQSIGDKGRAAVVDPAA